MQNSKFSVIIINCIIIIYYLLSEFFLKKLGNIYTYIINPLFWIILAIILKILILDRYKNKKIKDEILRYTLIASLSYMLIYIISGLFVTFGKNPYAHTIKGILMNLWIFGSVIIAREYVRYKLINNVSKKDALKIGTLIVIIFSAIEFNFIKVFSTNNMNIGLIFEIISASLIPIIAKNILFTYISFNSTYIASIVYELSTNMFLWIIPIFPNSPWVMNAIIDTVIPIILTLYIRYEKSKKSIHRSKNEIENANPREVFVLSIIVIIGIWFALGIFPVKPIAIATGSMLPVIHPGDVVILQKCSVNDIKEGDIIEYKLNGTSIVHRVKEIKWDDGECYFITKGDNNNDIDAKPVTKEQVVSKVLFKIRYIGYPAVWMSKVEK